jgi:uncharacterized protein (DUF362 family)/Pyruvate/2-oxoacid:ferredoxin oxidoreductase delta subunit
MMSKVFIASVEGDLAQPVGSIFDQFCQTLQGKKVLIKPNILSPTPPEAALTTHPDLVRAVVRECEARGAAEIKVGDCPGGLDRNSRHTAQQSGILEACLGHFFPLACRLARVPANSRYVEYFYVPQALLDADYVINLPKFKVSIQTTITGSIKNCYGYLAGGLKGQLHLKALGRRRFSEVLVSLFAVRPPDLSILEGLTIMDTLGPRGGRPRPWGRILASDDPVALDATAIRMMGQDPAREYSLNMAAERGFGTMSQDEIEILGEFAVIPDFVMPGHGFWSTEEAGKLLWEMGTLKPVVYPERCEPCDQCDYCPVGAIRLDGQPIIDYEACISCFACAEFCPRGAIEAPAGRAEELMKSIFRT